MIQPALWPPKRAGGLIEIILVAVGAASVSQELIQISVTNLERAFDGAQKGDINASCSGSQL